MLSSLENGGEDHLLIAMLLVQKQNFKLLLLWELSITTVNAMLYKFVTLLPWFTALLEKQSLFLQCSQCCCFGHN